MPPTSFTKPFEEYCYERYFIIGGEGMVQVGTTCLHNNNTNRHCEQLCEMIILEVHQTMIITIVECAGVTIEVME